MPRYRARGRLALRAATQLSPLLIDTVIRWNQLILIAIL
jgi:hypothetical protein